MKRSTSWPAAALLGLLITVASSSGAEEIQIHEIPYPQLDSLEPVVATQLKSAQDRLTELFGKEEGTANELLALYSELGALYHAYELWDPARASYANASLLDPQEARWHHLLGLVERETGNTEAAIASFRKSLEFQSVNTAAQVYLAEMLMKENLLDDAAKILKVAHVQAPSDPAVIAARGELAQAQGRPEEAVQLLEEALTLVPAANRLHYPLAQAYRTLENMDKAREHLALRGTVGVRPADPLADRIEDQARGERIFILRGRTAFQAGHYEEAAEAFRQAVNAEPNSARARVNLGSALGQTGDREGAIEQFEKSLEIQPENATAHFNLGLLLKQMNRFAEALPHLEATARITPDDATAHLELGRLLRTGGDRVKAVHHFRSARKLDPNLEGAYIGEADVHLSWGDTAVAREILEEAHASMPDQGRTAHALARVLAASPGGSSEDGERALDLALRVFNASNTITHAETVAMAYAKNGRCTEAAQWQGQALEAATRDGQDALAERLRRSLATYEGGPPCLLPTMSKSESQASPQG